MEIQISSRHRRSVTRNLGAQSDGQNFLRGTAIRTVTIFSLSYRKFKNAPPSKASKLGGGGHVPPWPPKCEIN